MLRWLRRSFLENLLLKIFALCLALLLYRYVKKDQDRISTVAVKLLFKYPKELIKVSETPPSLMVTLRGPDSKLRSADKKLLRYTLDLSKSGPGPSQYELYTDQLRPLFPPDIRVIRITPSIIDVILKKLARRSLPVEVRIKGKPALGYRLILPLKPFPLKVQVEGPEDSLKSYRKVISKPLDLTGRWQDQVRSVSLVSPGKSVKFLGVHKVRVKLRFHQIQSRKRFKDLPVKLVNFLNPRMRAVLDPDRVDVLVYGPLAQLQTVQQKDIIVQVDGQKLSSFPAGNYPRTVLVRLPAPDLTASRSQPSVIDVRLSPRPGEDQGASADAADKKEPKVPRRRRRRRRRRKPKKRRRKPKKRRRKPKKRRRKPKKRRRKPKKRSSKRHAPKKRPKKRARLKKRAAPRRQTMGTAQPQPPARLQVPLRKAAADPAAMPADGPPPARRRSTVASSDKKSPAGALPLPRQEPTTPHTNRAPENRTDPSLRARKTATEQPSRVRQTPPKMPKSKQDALPRLVLPARRTHKTRVSKLQLPPQSPNTRRKPPKARNKNNPPPTSPNDKPPTRKESPPTARRKAPKQRS